MQDERIARRKGVRGTLELFVRETDVEPAEIEVGHRRRNAVQPFEQGRRGEVCAVFEYRALCVVAREDERKPLAGFEDATKHGFGGGDGSRMTVYWASRKKS